MNVGDLFSGIGGFSLAAHWMGWRTAWFSEIDPFACAVLAHHWPEVPNLGDITRVDWTTVERVDVLTGGFPCQPHSLAGKRLASADSRDLFDEIIRAARVLRPRYLVLENVPGLFTSDDGRFFGRVLGAVAALGYAAEWRVLSAADVGAPHKRERVWITASVDDTASGGRRAGAELRVRRTERGCARVGDADGGRCEQRDARERGDAESVARLADVGHTIKPRLEGHSRDGADGYEPGRDRTRAAISTAASSVPVGWSDAIAVRGHDHTVRRIPREATGPESPLWPVAHGVPARVAQLRGIGNSIVPQCALEIFRAIETRETLRAAA